MAFFLRHRSPGGRFGERYAEFLRLAETGQTWSPEQIQEYQLKQLRQALIQAGNYCPYYTRVFHKAAFRPEMVTEFADLQECPYLERKNILAEPDQFLSSDVPAKDHFKTPSGFYWQRSVLPAKEQAFLEGQWKRGGYVPGQRMVVLSSGGAGGAASSRLSYDLARDWLLCPPSFLADERIHELLKAVSEFKASQLCAAPAEASRLVDILQRSGLTWPGRLSGLYCGSGGLSHADKQRLGQVFGCRVFRWFGSAELGVMAAEGANSSLLYFNPQYGLVELGEPNAQGLCEIIATSFHNLAMPLIRYRTGWFARLADPRADGALELPWAAASEIVAPQSHFAA